jgi:hypothetical protein
MGRRSARRLAVFVSLFAPRAEGSPVSQVPCWTPLVRRVVRLGGGTWRPRAAFCSLRGAFSRSWVCAVRLTVFPPNLPGRVPSLASAVSAHARPAVGLVNRLRAYSTRGLRRPPSRSSGCMASRRTPRSCTGWRSTLSDVRRTAQASRRRMGRSLVSCLCPPLCVQDIGRVAARAVSARLDAHTA